MKKVRTFGLLLLLGFAFSGCGVGHSYQASFEQTWEAYVGVVKEMGYITEEKEINRTLGCCCIPFSRICKSVKRAKYPNKKALDVDVMKERETATPVEKYFIVFKGKLYIKHPNNADLDVNIKFPRSVHKRGSSGSSVWTPVSMLFTEGRHTEEGAKSLLEIHRRVLERLKNKAQ